MHADDPEARPAFEKNTFQHAKILAAVVNAGKDCYCEKPMAETLEDAKLARAAVVGSKQVVQMGSQWVSEPVQRKIAPMDEIEDTSTVHSMVLQELTPGTTYYYQVYSSDQPLSVQRPFLRPFSSGGRLWDESPSFWTLSRI